jgi:hypothetical protein
MHLLWLETHSGSCICVEPTLAEFNPADQVQSCEIDCELLSLCFHEDPITVSKEFHLRKSLNFASLLCLSRKSAIFVFAFLDTPVVVLNRLDRATGPIEGGCR